VDVSRLFRVIVLGGAALGTACGSTPDDSCSGAACPPVGQATASSTTGTWTGRGSSSGAGTTTGGTGAGTTSTSTGSTSGGSLLPDGGVNFW
jgi:hypothetical protein